jgi:hypothetical protein
MFDDDEEYIDDEFIDGKNHSLLK